ncbi:aquaporin [Candidatus Saccharibacteria bacterium]|nr:aquaporin [Candidatus Saccharibacteria bacterium]
MATKKPKSSNKSNKNKTTKPKTAAKTVETPVSEAEITKTEEQVETPVEEVTVEETTVETSEVVEAPEKKAPVEATPAKTTTVVTAKKSTFSGFFSKKYAEKESILTIFKNPKFYGALLGEIIGTMCLTLVLFACSLMGIHSMATYAFALIAILIAVYAFSGACLNPIVTVGMMASRRMSVIRGVMYIIAEIIGAWLGWLIFNSLHLAGGETAYALPTMTAIGDGKFWITTMIELMGAIIIAFFFARALKYKRSVFTFAATVTGGIVLAVLIGYVASAAFLGLNNNFLFNPAAAMMFQIFPTAGENFGEIMGGVGQALAAYALFPVIGGVCGFYLADFTGKLSSEE